jgi:hypothetical protein
MTEPLQSDALSEGMDPEEERRRREEEDMLQEERERELDSE